MVLGGIAECKGSAAQSIPGHDAGDGITQACVRSDRGWREGADTCSRLVGAAGSVGIVATEMSFWCWTPVKCANNLMSRRIIFLNVCSQSAARDELAEHPAHGGR